MLNTYQNGGPPWNGTMNNSSNGQRSFNPGTRNLYVERHAQGQSGTRYVPAPVPGFGDIRSFAPRFPSVPSGFSTGQSIVPPASPAYVASDDPAPIGSVYPLRVVSKSQEIHCRLSYMKHEEPKIFYIVPVEAQFDRLERGICEYTQESEKMRNVAVPGDYWARSKVGLCHSNMMGRWVRCAVIRTSGDMVAEIFAVDYGFTEIVHVNQLRPIPCGLGSVEPHAIHCALQNFGRLEAAGLSGANAGRALQELLKGQTFRVVVEHIPPAYFQKTDLPLHPVEVSITLGGLSVLDIFSHTQSQIQVPSMRIPPHPMLTSSPHGMAFPSHLSSPVEVILTSFDGFEDFFGQFASLSEEAVAGLTLDLTNVFKDRRASSDAMGPDAVGKIVAAEYMGEFYRCQIVRERDATHFVGYFVDFGNTTDVPKNRTFPLGAAEQKFLNIPVMGMRCRAPGLHLRNLSNEGTQLFDGKQIEVHLRPGSSFGSCVSAKIDVDIPKNSANANFWTVVESFARIATHEIPPNAIREVFMIRFASMNEFYVGLDESSAEFHDLKAKMDGTSVASLSGPFRPKLGAHCLYRRTSNGSLFRASVESVDPVLALRFVDFGNVWDLQPGDELFAIPEELCKFKIQAIRSSSEIQPPLNSPAERAFARFVRQSADGTWQLEFLKLTPSAGPVAVAPAYTAMSPPVTTEQSAPALSPGSNQRVPVRDVEARLEPLAILPGTVADVYVSWFMSPGLIFLGLSENLGETERMVRELQTFYQGDVKTFDRSAAKEGLALCARFPEDGQWYRAEVIDVTPQTTRVLYVDFGNTSQVVSEDLRALDSAFLRRHKQAIPCAIHGLTRSSRKPSESPLDYWIRNFPNSADYGFRATFVGERGVGLRKRWEVNLVTKDGVDVADVLVRDGYADRTGRSPTERGERLERKSPKGNDVYRPPANRDRPASGAQAPDDRMREVRHKSEMKMEDRRSRQSDVDGDWRKRSPVASNSNPPSRRSEDDRRPSKPVVASAPKLLPARIEAADKYATPKFPLEPGTSVSIYVSYIENGRDFYAQLNSEYETIETLGRRVADAVERSSPRGQWTPDQPCLALWRDGAGETSWYRALVVADDGSEKIVVFFCDYGNEGEVARRFVLIMPKDLANPPPQAIRMRMKGLDPDASKEKFEAIALDQSFDAKLDDKVGDRWCVTLLGVDKRVINDVLDEGEDDGVEDVHEAPEVTCETVTSIVSSPTEEPILSSALPFVQPVIDDLTQAYIPVARDVQDIWFHRGDADTSLTELGPLLMKMYVPAPAPVKDVLVGQLVVALYEGSLYRAEVLAVTAKSLKLMLVDYGDIVDVPYGVFEFYKELLVIPRLAFRGRLSGLEEVLELYDEVPREVFDRLAPRALVEVGHEEPVDVKFIKREDGTYDVDSAALLLETLTKIKEMAGIKDEQPVVEDIVPQAGQEQPAEPAEEGLLVDVAPVPAEIAVEETSETEVGESAEPTSVSITKVLNLEVDDLPADLMESTIPLIVSPGEFYVVPILHLKALTEIREQLGKIDVKPENVRIGEIYGLKLPDMMLRVKILDESRALAIDRGSVHNYEKDQLVVIPPNTRAAVYPPLSIKCHLSGVAPALIPSDLGAGDGGMMLSENYDDWAKEAIDSFKDAVRECETILVSFHFKGPSVAVALHLENRDAAEDLVREMYGCRALMPSKLPTGPIEGYLGYVDVLSTEAIVVFFREADKEAFKKLNDQLEINAPLMDYWNGGQFCAALLGIEGLSGQTWVRARVKGEDAGDLALWAVDKCEEFTVPKNTVRQLPLGFFQVPALGTRLSISLDKYKDKMQELLAVINAGTFDREGIVAEVEEGQAGAIRKAKLFKKVDGDLVDFGQYLLDSFKEPETTVPEPIPEFKERTVPVPSTCGGVVTHMKSPSEFWVLRDDDDANLKQLMGRLADHYDEADNRKPVAKIVLGRACILALPEGSFLRVQVMKDGFASDTSSLVMVKAVDYGTVHCANKGSLFEIEKQFLEDPIFAVLCKLKIATPENGKWAVEAIEAFDVILGADRAERHFNIQFLSDMMSDDGSISFAVDMVDAAGGSVTAKFTDGGFGERDLTCADCTLDSVESGGSDAGDNIDEDTASDGEMNTIDSVAKAEDHLEPEDPEKIASTNGEH